MIIIFSLFPENTGTDVIISYFRTDTLPRRYYTAKIEHGEIDIDITWQIEHGEIDIDTDIKLELSLACHIFSSLSAVIMPSQMDV